ncbi:MAG TPA: hypothetical protein GX742_00750 [Acholeplasmataceae bacterium]|nr:hypothetical protein [Acholeplasmataceae bacterium]
MKITILNFFTNIWDKINELVAKLKFDDKFMQLYETFFAGLDEVFKWLIAIFLIVIFIFGVIAFIKKTFKVFIVLAIIAAIIILFL